VWEYQIFNKTTRGDLKVADSTLEMYKEVLPHLKDFIPKDFMLGLTDGNQFVGFWSKGKMNAPVKIGDILKPDDPMRDSFRTGRVIDTILPPSIHGFPFRSITVPVRNKQNKIVGTVGFGLSLEVENEVKAVQKNIDDNVNSSLKDLENIASFSQDISKDTALIINILENILKKTDKINSVTKEISSISGQTNILAINASIEAAHAGELGKGFAIVAQQMRELANTSKNSSNEILDLLNELSSEVRKISSDLDLLINSIDGQQNLTSNISKNIYNIKHCTESITNILKD